MRQIIGIATAVALCLGTLTSCENVEFNQTANKKDLITETYSRAAIEKLESPELYWHMTFAEFSKQYKVQCARKTPQGCYVVLLLEDGRDVFVFFNKKNILIHVMVVDKFKTKEEFQKQVVEQMPQSKVVDFDSNTIASSVSAMSGSVTGHIVQEGIFVVRYSTYREEEYLVDPVVVSIEFIENKNIANAESFVTDDVPYVLEIDKIN